MSKNMNTYMSVSVTYCNDGSTYTDGHMYVNVESAKLDIYTKLSKEEAKRQLAKLALKLGRQPIREINRYNPAIITLFLNGFLE